MFTELVMYISIIIAAVSILISGLVIRRAKKQIAEMADALADIKSGNGNRRILSEEHEMIAPLAYKINEIVVSYENRLTAFRQTEGVAGGVCRVGRNRRRIAAAAVCAP